MKPEIVAIGEPLVEFSHSKVIACAGSWLVKSKLIVKEKFDKITRLTRVAVLLVRKARRQ